MGFAPDSNLLTEIGSQKKVTKVTALVMSRYSKYSIGSKPLRYVDDLKIYHSVLSVKLFYPEQQLKTFVTEDGYSLTVSDDVLCLTPAGWRPFGELQVDDVIWTNGNDVPAYTDRESLKRLYIDQDMTQGEIASLLGVSERTIRAYVQRFDLGKGQGPKLFGEDNPNWKGDNVSKRGGYERTRNHYNRNKAGICSRCGRELPTQLHHDDRNPVNTEENNLIELCDLCHAAEHHGEVIKWTRPARITDIRYGGSKKTLGFELENGDNVVVEGFIVKCPRDNAKDIIIMEKI